jgi:dTDP-4-amino-4,6-dideoxygalactose transaminase
LGDVAVFSLEATKLCPAGEGGMLVTGNSGIWERVLRLGQYQELSKLKSPNRRFNTTGFGWNFRMAPLSAALARVQLRHLSHRNEKRNKNIGWLSLVLQEMGFDTFLPEKTVTRTYYEFNVLADRKKICLSLSTLVSALQAEGAQVSYAPLPLLHQQPLFREGRWRQIARLQNLDFIPDYSHYSLPVCESLAGNILHLPSFPQATDSLLEQYVTAFRKCLFYQEELGKKELGKLEGTL